MSNIRFLWKNRCTATGTALVASSSVPALPVAAIKNSDRSYVWRSLTGTGVQTIGVDFGGVYAVNSAALANARVLQGGVVELYQRGDGVSPDAAVLVATFGAPHPFRRATAVFFAEQSHRHWELRFTNPAAVDAFAELGAVFLGQYYEPPVNVSVPISVTRTAPDVVSESSDGQKSTAVRSKFDVGVWSFQTVNAAQKAEVEAMFEEMGTGVPMFVVLDPADISATIWMSRIAHSIPFEIKRGIGRFGVEIPWEEAR